MLLSDVLMHTLHAHKDRESERACLVNMGFPGLKSLARLHFSDCRSNFFCKLLDLGRFDVDVMWSERDGKVQPLTEQRVNSAIRSQREKQEKEDAAQGASLYRSLFLTFYNVEAE